MHQREAATEGSTKKPSRQAQRVQCSAAAIHSGVALDAGGDLLKWRGRLAEELLVPPVQQLVQEALALRGKGRLADGRHHGAERGGRQLFDNKLTPGVAGVGCMDVRDNSTVPARFTYVHGDGMLGGAAAVTRAHMRGHDPRVGPIADKEHACRARGRGAVACTCHQHAGAEPVGMSGLTLRQARCACGCRCLGQPGLWPGLRHGGGWCPSRPWP